MIKNKKRHNKKRNTAFLYETLIREMTKAVLDGDADRKKRVVSICKEHFSKDSLLLREKELYYVIHEASNLDKDVATKLLEQAKQEFEKLDQKVLFNEKTALINKINKSLGSSVFSNFIPDYKNLATISQIFSKSGKIKDRVLLEKALIERMVDDSDSGNEGKMASIDKLTYKTFVESFNTQYGESLLEEQREIITRYVMSFVDNGIEMKYYLNEEIGRLKQGVRDVIENDRSLLEDEHMARKADVVLEMLHNMNEKPIDEEMISKILKIQKLVKESGDSRNDS